MQVLFTLTILLVLLPRIAVLHTGVRNRTALLLLLPAELINGLPDVKKMVANVIAENESGTDGGGSSGGRRSSIGSPSHD